MAEFTIKVYKPGSEQLSNKAIGGRLQKTKSILTEKTHKACSPSVTSAMLQYIKVCILI